MREIILKKIEERVVAAKIHTGEKLTEDLISIKAYCDLLLEAEKDERPATVSAPRQSAEKPKLVTHEKPDSDSLFDF
ncbi:hypothetical protein DS745_05470 [Anaerobacillus alkaliphilus]|uniref:YwdI family protein n=1 Tax=Anaerobacillus alkaliphilus TaxID=1548597 RepID=A0A4Q0VVV3_9BACI|nr:DUF5327 family protein [Anaerobacillus alkaliphilus]RXJ02762.1 hypothetical protein DS745_05470 [Anaerobacillus alkaliphilus]